MNAPNAKLNPQKVREMRRLRAEGWTYPALSRHFQVSENTVARTCKGNAWMKVTQGVEVVTDGEAELKMLTNPPPPINSEEQKASIARLLAVQEEVNRQREQPQPSALDEYLQQQSQDRGPGRVREVSPPRPPVRVRYPGKETAQPQEQPQEQESGTIHAEKLLETLKDETQNQIQTGRNPDR